MSNYFDRVLFGNIVKEWKTMTKPIKSTDDHVEKPTDEEIKKNIDDRITEMYLEYSSSGTISGVVSGVYNYLFKSGKLPKHNAVFKTRIFARAKKIAKAEAMTKTMSSMDEKRNLKITLEKIESGADGSVKVVAKRLILMEYFNEIKEENENS